LAGHDAAAQNADPLQEPDAAEQEEDDPEDQWTFAHQRILRCRRTVPHGAVVLSSTVPVHDLFLQLLRWFPH